MHTEYAPVLRRLQGAAASREFEASMRLEDEVTEAWIRMERDIAERDGTIAQQQEALAQRDEALARRQAEIEELRRRLDRQGR